MDDRDEVSLKMDETDKEIIKVSEYLDVISEAAYKLKRQITNSELELDDLRQQIRKGKSNLSRLRTQRGIYERDFWRKRT